MYQCNFICLFHVNVTLSPFLYLYTQVTTIEDQPVNVDGSVTVGVGEEGTTVVITFFKDTPLAPISVSPIEVTACAEAGNEARIYIREEVCWV